MTLTLGLPRMNKEVGERRDFLPQLVKVAAEARCEVRVERGLGSGLGLSDSDYTSVSARVEACARERVWASDVVLVLRSPEVEEYDRLLRPGSTLMSMLHFATRPRRVDKLKELGVDAVSLDSITDDQGARRVENTRAVGWNGLEMSFSALERFSPWRLQPGAEPVRVTVLGSGQVGRHAIDAATKYGSVERSERWAREGRPAAVVTVVGRALMAATDHIRALFGFTDVLVDASQRQDPSTPLVRNAWLGDLPAHAVICDLVVDPYVLATRQKTVRSIEGIPRGDLDRQIFAINDPAWATTVPASVSQHFRRTVVSCYSWPGVHPEMCMRHYGRQLEPLLRTLLEKGGARGLSPDGAIDERALWRGTLAAHCADSRLARRGDLVCSG